MGISRRKVLHGIGVGTVTAVAMPRIAAGQPFFSTGATETPGPIHLDRNENPYGPPESATAAMRDGVKSPNRYPDPSALQKKIAEHHRVASERVVLGCGSTEVLRMAADA